MSAIGRLQEVQAPEVLAPSVAAVDRAVPPLVPVAPAAHPVLVAAVPVVVAAPAVVGGAGDCHECTSEGKTNEIENL